MKNAVKFCLNIVAVKRQISAKAPFAKITFFGFQPRYASIPPTGNMNVPTNPIVGKMLAVFVTSSS